MPLACVLQRCTCYGDARGRRSGGSGAIKRLLQDVIVALHDGGGNKQARSRDGLSPLRRPLLEQLTNNRLPECGVLC